jgi:hypothetical protein
MLMRSARSLQALLVLFVLLGSQVAYAAGGSSPAVSDHCARSAPPQEKPADSCPLPLWLTCCDDQAAVSAGAGSFAPAAQLVLPLETALVAAPAATLLPRAARAEIPPDTPYRLSTVLLI